MIHASSLQSDTDFLGLSPSAEDSAISFIPKGSNVVPFEV